MKKQNIKLLLGILFFAIITLTIISFDKVSALTYCDDTDNGNEPTITGSTENDYQKKDDFCILNGFQVYSCEGVGCQLKEFYCNTDFVIYNQTYSTGGFLKACQNGRLLPKLF